MQINHPMRGLTRQDLSTGPEDGPLNERSLHLPALCFAGFSWVVSKMFSHQVVWIPRDFRMLLLFCLATGYVCERIFAMIRTTLQNGYREKQPLNATKEGQPLSNEEMLLLWQNPIAQKDICQKLSLANFEQLSSIWEMLSDKQKAELKQTFHEQGYLAGTSLPQLLGSFDSCKTESSSELQGPLLHDDFIELIRKLPDYWVGIKSVINQRPDSGEFKLLLFKVHFKTHFTGFQFDEKLDSSEKIDIEFHQNLAQSPLKIKGVYVEMLTLIGNNFTTHGPVN